MSNSHQPPDVDRRRRLPAAVVATCSLLLLVSGCQENRENRRRPEAGPVLATAGHPLAGTWRGVVTSSRFGAVAGVVRIDSRGHGTAIVTARGLTFAEAITIESWRHGELTVRHKGTSYSLAATLTGDRLQVDLPYLSTTVLKRDRR